MGSLFISGSLNIIPLVLLFASLGVVLIIPKVQKRKTVKLQKVAKVIVAVLLIGAAVLRFAPLFCDFQYECPDKVGDSSTHYYGAQQIVQQGSLDEKYTQQELRYPFLIPYTITLSVFNRFLPIKYSIVLSNVFFDCAGLVGIRKLFRKRKKCKKYAAILWITNPISIFSCWLPLNLVLVNVIVVFVLMEYSLLLESIYDRSKKDIVLRSMLLGLLLFVGNMYRPVFFVFLIAIVIVTILGMEKNKKSIFDRSVSVVLCILMAVVPMSLYQKVVTGAIGEDVYDCNIGWSFYLGSNYDTKGQWSLADYEYYDAEFYAQEGSFPRANKRALRYGLHRYRLMGVIGSVSHFANKAQVLFGRISESMYDIAKVFVSLVEKHEIMYTSIMTLISVYMLTLYLSILGAFEKSFLKNDSKKKEYAIFILLSLLGLTASFLLVEVSSRYFTMFMPILITMAAGRGQREKRENRVK